jgi:hypothetical protein
VVDVAVVADAAVAEDGVEGAVEDVVEGAAFPGLPVAVEAAATRGPPVGEVVGEVTHVLRAGAAEATPVRPAAGLHDLRNCLPAAGPHARPVAEFHVPPAGVEVLHDPLNCLPVVLRVQAEVACLRLQASVPRVEIDLRSAGAHLNCLRAIVQAEVQRTDHRSCLRDRVPARARVRVPVRVPEHSLVSAQAKGMLAISLELQVVRLQGAQSEEPSRIAHRNFPRSVRASANDPVQANALPARNSGQIGVNVRRIGTNSGISASIIETMPGTSVLIIASRHAMTSSRIAISAGIISIRLAKTDRGGAIKTGRIGRSIARICGTIVAIALRKSGITPGISTTTSSMTIGGAIVAGATAGPATILGTRGGGGLPLRGARSPLLSALSHPIRSTSITA